MMISRILAGVLAPLLAWQAPLFAQELHSDEETAALQQAAALGAQIYRYDQAAWHTTDVFIAQIPDAASKGFRGWVVNELGDSLEVVFYRDNGDELVAGWSGNYDGREVTQTKIYGDEERALTASELAQIEAVQLGVRQEMYRCSQQSFNPVVLPTGKEDGGLYVYFLTPQPTLNDIPFGGHFRHEVVGGEVVASRSFTNSCITLPKTNKEGERPVAMTISHILDPTPTEIHVFSSFVAGMPIYVITTQNEYVWSTEIVDGAAQFSKSSIGSD